MFWTGLQRAGLCLGVSAVLSMQYGCSPTSTTQTVYVHDTVEVKPAAHVGLWESGPIYYTSGDRGVWRLSLTADSNYSFARLDTTRDTLSYYYSGAYIADGVTMTLYNYDYRRSDWVTAGSYSRTDVCAYTVSTDGQQITITENGPDMLFNTASHMVFTRQ
jgi:hypothetical protein